MSWSMDSFVPSGLAQTPNNIPDGVTSTSQHEPKGKTKATRKPKEAGEAGPKRKRKYNTSKNAGAASTSVDGGIAGNTTQGDDGNSRSGSTAPNQQGLTTPTKRKMSTAGGGGKRKASRGRGRGSTQAENRASRGSRGTSVRASLSVNPAGAPSTQPQGEDEEEYPEGALEDDAEIEDDDEEEEGVGLDLEEEEWHRQEAFQKAKSEAMGPLMRAMNDVQQDRYSVYRRTYLEKRHVRRLITHLTTQTPSQQVVTLTAAIAKVYVGEIVERARSIQKERGESGPLRPLHLTEANRQYKKEREVPGRLPPGMHSVVSGSGGNGKRRRFF